MPSINSSRWRAAMGGAGNLVANFSLPSFVNRPGLRAPSLVFAVVVVVLLGGLVVGDRLLSQTDRTRASVDAVKSASLIEGFLAVRVTALSALRGAQSYASGEEVAERFVPLAGELQRHLAGFRRVFYADSSGTIRRDLVLTESGIPPLMGVDLDTLQRLRVADAMRRARREGTTQVSASGVLFAGDSGLILLEPLTHQGLFVGVVGGVVPANALLAAALKGDDGARLRLMIEGDGDTIAVLGDVDLRAPTVRAQAVVELPGGGQWDVHVTLASTTEPMRALFWALGLAVLTAITAIMIRERRQTLQIAERSTELERLSGELLRANRAKSEFLASMSHELRTPLNAIVGFVDLLCDGVYGELAPRQIAPVERIAGSANHLRHLVDQVLDLGKMAAGRLEVHIEPMALRPFVLEVASEIEPLLQEKGLQLSIAIGATLPRVRTDPTHLRQIIVNLLGNALKYTDFGGVAVRSRLVGVPSRASGQQARVVTGSQPRFSDTAVDSARAPTAGRPYVALQIADTGIGIAPENHQRIFDEFEQVNPGPRSDSFHRGTGLGLAISRRLARLLGGELTVDSELSKGATFTLWIPLHPSDVAAAGSAGEGPVGGALPGPKSASGGGGIPEAGGGGHGSEKVS
ncbi:MAG TPA: HAMP domain-containing sensor histidine kinase [Gemmatimonadaceae bacterium]|nr:HAMP domain-containing sensor histidine kinase [Gemmatimonadaceae bacterium]